MTYNTTNMWYDQSKKFYYGQLVTYVYKLHMGEKFMSFLYKKTLT